MSERHPRKKGKVSQTYINPQQNLKGRSNFSLKLSSDSQSIIFSGKRFQLSITLLEVYFLTSCLKEGLNILRV